VNYAASKKPFLQLNLRFAGGGGRTLALLGQNIVKVLYLYAGLENGLVNGLVWWNGLWNGVWNLHFS